MPSPSASDLLRDVEARVKDHEPAAGVDARAFRDLAAEVAKRADEHLLLQDDGARWLRMTERMLTFGATRQPEEILVGVASPRDSLGAGRTILCTCMPDQSFIIDSVRLALQQAGIEFFSQVNVVIPVERDEAGAVAAVGSRVAATGRTESWALFEVGAIATAAERKSLAKELEARLTEVRAVAGDFRRMLRQMKDLVNQIEFLASVQPARREELDEVRHFLEWLSEDHFVFFGTTVLGRDGKPSREDSLGLSRLRDDPFVASYPQARKWLKTPDASRGIVTIAKTSEESRLHRSGKIDEILVRTHDDRGKVNGAVAIHGLFTYRAIQTRGSIVPLLRQKMTEVVRREDVTPGSFNYKAIVNAFNALPVEYLFGADPGDIRELIHRTLAADRARKLEVHVATGAEKRTAFVFVVMPRAQYSDERREKIQDYLISTLGANYVDHRALLHSHGVAVLHFYLSSANPMKVPTKAAVEREIVSLSATWTDRFREALLEVLGRDEAIRLYATYHEAFSGRYQLSTDGSQVIVDVLNLEAIRNGSPLELALYRDEEDVEQGTMKLRLYSDHDIMLSDIMPILENFGLRVVNSFANHARLETTTLTLETFRFVLEHEALETDPKLQSAFLEALRSVFAGRAANDALNRVLLPAGLDGQQIVILRSYQGYAKQLGNMTTPGSIHATLVKHSAIVRRIIDLFEAKFGPSGNGRVPNAPSAQRKKDCAKLVHEILEAIDRVESFNEDRILRIFANLVDATLRTSYYAKGRQHPSVAHKFDCARVASMQGRRPWREIYVHHFNLEGVHLRGGRIARGGLRWSDRLDDFRTEILGLMTTQMVKNVVIVPLGAKGGFVIRQLPADPAERRAAADDHYEIFIHALLDLTDNMVDGEVVPPSDVVRWDEPDPYLVVAADKGTAHLSDRANAISASRDFWLSDAFASGGSNGYDHKAIGITARGAWVSIRHLLREIGVNAAKDEFTVIGIGDMGGDVFGNGLIEHPTIKLQAAFNHLHIFLDPDPDPAASFKERKRLFRARSGGWDAYDTKVISKGGGVFDRHAKRIPLSVPVRKMLGIEETELSGAALIQAILKMPCDLWYNGGIGTYVKASVETHADAADPSNDSVRVDASELQAKVVGEGGNLGFTQAARIEFAARGGRINTDFIDNAGGVNISDHEVNLKILFAPQVNAGRMTMNARNKLLPEIEPVVTSDVLEAQGDQARMISLDERRSNLDLAPFDRVMDEVTKHFALSRRQISLPSVRETERRMAEGEALTRPELATLSAFVKMKLYDELLEDPKIEMEGLLPAVHNYFPDKVRKRFAKAIEEHSLRREIALTRLTNRIIDHTGATFFNEMQNDAGANSRQTFEAYSFLSRAADLWHFKDQLWDLGWKVEVQTLYEALLIIENALRLGTRHLLEHWPEDKVIEGLRQTGPHAKKIRSLASGIEAILDPVSLERVHGRTQRFSEAGIPKAMATRLAHIRYLPRALVVLDLAGQAKRPAKAVAKDYFALGRASRLFDVIHWIDELRPEAYYDALAYRALRRELHELLSRLVLRLLSVPGTPSEKLDSLGAGREAFAQLERLPAEQLTPSVLMVAVRDMRQVLGES